MLVSKHSGEPGPWRSARTPYQVEILNCMNDPAVEDVVFISSRQVGKSITIENIAGYCMEQDPCPVQLVLPSQDSADKQFARIKDMVDASPEIAKEKTGRAGDWKRNLIQTNRMSIRLGWASAPNTLKGNSNRILLGDETEAWEMSKEGHPWEVLWPSTKAFHRPKRYMVTTPLTDSGYTWQRYLKSDQRRFWVPCPHCAKYQVLYFSAKTLRWPKHERDPQVIYDKKLADYHCEHCEKPIPHERKGEMLLAGRWVPECCEITDEGEVRGEPEQSSLRGYHLGGLASPFVKWWDMARAFMVLNEQYMLNSFRNLWEGLPFQDTALEAQEDQIAKLEKPYELHGAIPNEVQRLGAGVDVQWSGGDHVWYVVRGYGPRDESWLLDEGRFDADAEQSDLDKLLEYLTLREWRREDGTILMWDVDSVWIDAGDGNRTVDVYDASQLYDVVMPLQGKDSANQPIVISNVEKFENMSFPGSIRRASVDTDYFKKKITGKINKGVGHWMPVDASLLYKRSLQSEHRVREKAKNGRVKYFWRLKAGQTQNHLWDCEVYCAASAWHQVLHRLVDPSEFEGDAPTPDSDDDWLGGRGGGDWLGSRGDDFLGRRR